MNRKYLSSFLIGAGVFSSALGNVAFANPFSDEEWAKYEEKLNEAHKIEESFIQRFFNYFKVLVWRDYYEDCKVKDRKVKEYTDKNIAVLREILGIFKDTFGLEALDDCRLTCGGNKNVTCNYVNDYDQIFSLQKERKLLNAFGKLFGNKEKLNKYVIFCEDSSEDFLQQGGVFGKLEELLGNALKIFDEREDYVNDEKAHIDRKFWDRLKNYSSFLKYTTSNVAIAKKILDVLKDDFNIGVGAYECLRQVEAKFSCFPSVGCNDPALFAEEYLLRCIGVFFEHFYYLTGKNKYEPPEKIKKGGIENFRKKIKELKELMSIAACNAKKRVCFSESVFSEHCSNSLERWQNLIADANFTSQGTITVFSERYEQKCLGSA